MIEAIKAVFDNTTHSGSALSLLLAIADSTNSKPDHPYYGYAWPSVASLAKKINLGERATHKILERVRASGELVIHYKAGENGCNLYEIRLGLLGRENVDPELAFSEPCTPVQGKQGGGPCTPVQGTLNSGSVDPALLFSEPCTLIHPIHDIHDSSMSNPRGGGDKSPPPPLLKKNQGERPLSREPTACDVYAEITGYSIKRVLRQEVNQTVGGDTDFWRQVVRGWMGKYGTPNNIDGMLDHFKRREIPGAKQNGGQHAKNGRHRPPGDADERKYITKRTDLSSREEYWFDERLNQRIPAPAWAKGS